MNKIELFIFDEIYGFTHEMYRFAPDAETGLLEKALLSHLSPAVARTGNYDMNIYPGWCFQCGKNIKKMILGLSESNNRLWYRKE